MALYTQNTAEVMLWPEPMESSLAVAAERSIHIVGQEDATFEPDRCCSSVQ